MKKHNKLFTALSIVSMILIPFIFVCCGTALVFPSPFDYNKTLIKNIGQNSDSAKNRFILHFSNSTYLKDWDNFSKIFNSDFYGYACLFRTSSKAIELVNESSTSFNVLLSDIQSANISNNETQNLSDLKIDVSMLDFEEYDIFVNDELASQLSLSVGNPVTIKNDVTEISLKIGGIYSHINESKRFLNDSYYEFENPVCFVSKKVFNTYFSESYDSFIGLGFQDDILEGVSNELRPFLRKNDSILEIDNSFSLNNFLVKGQAVKQYQENLLKIHRGKTNLLFYLYIATISIYFISSSIILSLSLSTIIKNGKYVYKFGLGLGLVYSLFFVCLALLSAFILSKFLLTTVLSGYTMFNSIGIPLALIAGGVLLYILNITLTLIINCKRKYKEVKIIRAEELKSIKKDNNKIVFITGSLSRGGAEKVIVELANYYASLGREVDIVILLKNQVGWDLDENINVVNFTGNTNSRLRRIGYWLKNLKSYLHDNNGATIVSFLVRVNLLVLLSAKKKEHKIIVSERNDPRYDGRGLLIRILVNILYPKADTIVFQTEECKKMFLSNIQDLGVVIPNPIKIKSYALPRKYKKKYFITAGRIDEQKNQIVMIKAMREVIKIHDDAILEIYGDGDLEKKLKIKIISYGLEKNVFIYPNTKDINKKILSSMFYISTSHYEGMSNSLMEASFAGVPCISTPCLGTNFIHNDENGIIIDFDSYKQLSSVLLDMLGNNNKYQNMRNTAITNAKKAIHQDVYLRWKECIDNE